MKTMNSLVWWVSEMSYKSKKASGIWAIGCGRVPVGGVSLGAL